LAHLLQGLILAAASALFAPAAGKPFSHKLHLKLGLQCASCHSSATSTQPSDNNMPTQEACRACHEQPPSIKSPTATLVTRFSHQQHLRLGNFAPVIAAAIDGKTYHSLPAPEIRRHLNSSQACAACHRGMEESDQVSKANMPQMADCLVCHPRIDNPFSCEMCHAPGPHLKPASHTTHFLDSHSTGRANLDKPSCVICHGKRFTCLGCH
jgi:predicted CXXCH cytochrome family protein